MIKETTFYAYALPSNSYNYCVFSRFFFHTEEGLYTRNVCVNRQFWHFAIITSLIINLIFYLQVSRNTKDFLV